MPKIEEFYPSRASGSNDHICHKRWSATRRTRRAHAAQALREPIILGILDLTHYRNID